MNKIYVFLADGNYLVREGLKSIMSVDKTLVVSGEANDSEDLHQEIKRKRTDLLVIDFNSQNFELKDIQIALLENPELKVLAITTYYSQSSVLKAIESGITGYILKDCGKEEVIDAIKATGNGTNFFCGKIIESIVKENTSYIDVNKVASCCEPVNLSNREIEIVKMIAEGFTNKEIADKLFLSSHTIITHRKNIMAKIGVKNTAGIVVFAVKESLVLSA
jgi:DNA-binding NarL/FixJ family response regulator